MISVVRSNWPLFPSTLRPIIPYKSFLMIGHGKMERKRQTEEQEQGELILNTSKIQSWPRYPWSPSLRNDQCLKAGYSFFISLFMSFLSLFFVFLFILLAILLVVILVDVLINILTERLPSIRINILIVIVLIVLIVIVLILIVIVLIVIVLIYIVLIYIVLIYIVCITV